MKCLSVSQPFSDLIISGKKIIELRSWNTHFRGEFLIHSPILVRKNDARRLHMNYTFTTGAIIGQAEIFDVKMYDSIKSCKLDYNLHFSSNTKKYGFMLRGAKPFRVPIPWKGKLGFFDANIDEKVQESHIITEIIDEEYRYQWIGRH